MITRGSVPLLREAAAVGVLVIMGGCGPSALPPPEGGSAPTSATTYVYRCEGGHRFSIAVGSDEAVLEMEAAQVVLPHVISASGARYAADGVTFWSRGLEASLETPSVAYDDCIGKQVATPAEEARLLAGDDGAGTDLEAAEWVLMSAGGVPAVPTEDGALPQLSFGVEPGRIAGFTGCNRIIGEYVREDDRLSFPQPLGTTRMACGAPYLAEQESRMLAVLGRIDGYFIWGTVLTLLTGDQVAARFTASNAAAMP